MLKRLFSIHNNQKGFTLIELLVAIAIAGIITVVIAEVTTQVITVNSADSNRIDAVKQVENGLHWINRDAQMAWPSSIDTTPNTTTVVDEDNNTTTTTITILQLTWIDYSDDPNVENMVYNVKYKIESKENDEGIIIYSILWRSQSINDEDTPDTYIAGNIDLDNSSCIFDGQVLTVNLTSTVEGLRSATETRTLQVKPRTNH